MTRNGPGPTLLFVTLAEKIRILRESKGLTQYALAKAAGMNQSQLAAIEKGRNQNPGVFTVQRIASALDASVDYLIEDDPNSVTARDPKLAAATRLVSAQQAEAREVMHDPGSYGMTDPKAGTRTKYEWMAFPLAAAEARIKRIKGLVVSDEEIEANVKEIAVQLERIERAAALLEGSEALTGETRS